MASDSGSSSSSEPRDKKKSKRKDKDKHEKSRHKKDKGHKHKKKDKHKRKRKHAEGDKGEVIRSVISGKRIRRQLDETEEDIRAREERELRLKMLNEDEATFASGRPTKASEGGAPKTVDEFLRERMKAARQDPKLMAQIMEEAKEARRAKRDKWAARLGRAPDDAPDALEERMGARDAPSRGFPGHMQA